MSRFSHQISFTSAAWHVLVQRTNDPLADLLVPIESLGGKLLDAFFTEGSFDVLAITEFPDSVSAADLSIAFYTSGAVASLHTVQILSASQAQEAKRNSGTRTYRFIPRALGASAT